jgi:phosphatidylglycerophosphate synthase
MMSSRTLVNAISLSRIPIALLFVLFFAHDKTFFEISVAICCLALTTDFLDGYLARRFGIATIAARHWDSLGDKAFYVAVIVAFLSNGLLGSLLSWALLFREVALYITRILYFENIAAVERIRPLTNWHGYFMYLTIGLGMIDMYGRLEGKTWELYPYIQITGAGALAFGVASIFAFIRLDEDKRM